MDKGINTCEFLNICQTNCSGTLEDTEVCHCYELYKQLKRKDQELQEAMDNYVQLDLQRVKEYNELVDLYKTKEQEGHNIQSELIEANKQVIYLAEQIDQLKAKNEKLKQTLKEIKEIAEKQTPYMNIDKAKTMIEIEYDYAGKIYNLEQRMYKILQKISEVEND